MRHTASRVKQWSECYPIFSSYDFARNTPQTHFSLLFRSLYHTYLSSGDVKAEPPECIYIKKVRKKEKHSPMNRWLSSMKISTDFHLFQNVTVTVFTQFFFFPPPNSTHLFYSCSSCVPQIHLLTEDTETVTWIQNNLRLREVEK